MNREEFIELKGLSETTIAITPEAETIKANLLMEAAFVTKITDVEESNLAAEILRLIKDVLAAIESGRKDLKAPILEIGRELDDTAKEFKSGLEDEVLRISKSLGTYQNEIRLREMKAKQEAERERREATLIAKAKLEQAQRDEERKLAEAKTDFERQAIEAEAIAKEDAIFEEAKIATEKAEAAIIATKAAEPKGVRLSKRWMYEVEDLNLLFKKSPELCKIEPNASAIRIMIKQDQNIPGLRIWEEIKSQ